VADVSRTYWDSYTCELLKALGWSTGVKYRFATSPNDGYRSIAAGAVVGMGKGYVGVATWVLHAVLKPSLRDREAETAVLATPSFCWASSKASRWFLRVWREFFETVVDGFIRVDAKMLALNCTDVTNTSRFLGP
jgi:hypothetical protein